MKDLENHRRTTIHIEINREKDNLMHSMYSLTNFGSITPTDNNCFGSLNNRMRLYSDKIYKSNRKAHIIKYK